ETGRQAPENGLEPIPQIHGTLVAVGRCDSPDATDRSGRSPWLSLAAVGRGSAERDQQPAHGHGGARREDAGVTPELHQRSIRGGGVGYEVDREAVDDRWHAPVRAGGADRAACAGRAPVRMRRSHVDLPSWIAPAPAGRHSGQTSVSPWTVHQCATRPRNRQPAAIPRSTSTTAAMTNAATMAFLLPGRGHGTNRVPARRQPFRAPVV